MSAAPAKLTVIEPPLSRPLTLMGVGVRGVDWKVVLGSVPDGTTCLALDLPDEELERSARRQRPEVALVPFTGDRARARALVALLQRACPGITLLALAEVPDPGAIREALRSGFRDFLVLPEDLPSLRRTLREVAERRPEREPAPKGRTVALMGAKGGSGTTLLAVNLAAELALHRETLLLDLDFGLGDAAVFLDLNPERGVNDVLRNIDRLDRELLSATLARHSERLRLLAQPRLPLEDVAYDADAVLRTLELAAELGEAVVLDCGAGVNEATMAAASSVDRVVIVCTPDVPSVRAAWVRLTLLDRLGVDQARVSVVVNRWGSQGSLSRREIQDHLGRGVLCTLNDEPKSTSHAINEGLLLRDRAARGKLCRDIAQLGEVLMGEEGRSAGGGRVSWFGWTRSAAK
jgi:pilus assembly protein CpaE